MHEIKLIIEPDAEDPDFAQVLADGTIGGRPYRFLIDTGAAQTSVLRDNYTASFISSGTKHSSGVFAGMDDDIIVIPSVGVGTLVKHNQAVTRSDPQRPGNRPLIGMDFLKDHCCRFFFDQPRLVLDDTLQGSSDEQDSPDEQGKPGEQGKAAFHELVLDTAFHPYVSVSFGNASARTVWDTGAGITIADLAFIRKHPLLFDEIASTVGTDASGTQQQTPLFLMAACVIGGQAFPPVKAAGVDLSRANAGLEIPMDLILGYTTLCQANWLFDFPHRRWTILKMLGSRSQSAACPLPPAAL